MTNTIIMDINTILEFSNVSKKFSNNLSSLVRYGITDIAKNVLGFDTHCENLRKNEFWAVDNVSFKLKKGESLGIIGPNGSGKSTILKMINGILAPDKGHIKVKGKVGALIEVGAGFHPLLTGRENIYINGTILGMSKKEIDGKFDDIVNFADIGNFLDSPVKTYSSGMHVRLGFSIAVHADPDILLVDEILAVGDYNFQRKCFETMKEKIKNGTTLILVSHNFGNILGGTTKSILLNHGKKELSGESRDVTKKYIEELNKSVINVQKQLKTSFRRGSGEVRIIDAYIVDSKGNRIQKISKGSPIIIKCNFKVYKPVKSPIFFFMVKEVNTRETVLFASSENYQLPNKLDKDGELEFIFRNPNIGCRSYYLCGGIITEKHYNAPLDMWDDAGERFLINDNCTKVNDLELISNPIINIPYEFTIKF